MSRPMRIEYPGAIYHITSRGNEKGDIFYESSDRSNFLCILADVIKRYNWLCHSYCLMSNHYHLLVETLEANLSSGMRQLNGVYSQQFNFNHERVGHLFQGRYKSIIVERESYLLELCRYIVLNPVRSNMVSKPEDYQWSSYRFTTSLQECPGFLNTDWLLKQFGDKPAIACKKYIEFVYAGIGCESPWNNLRGQVILGKENFLQDIEPLIEEKANIAEIPREQRLVLQQKPADLTRLCKLVGVPAERNKIMYELHYKNGMPIKEIATMFNLHPGSVSRLLKKLGAGLTSNKM